MPSPIKIFPVIPQPIINVVSVARIRHDTVLVKDLLVDSVTFATRCPTFNIIMVKLGPV